MMMIMIRTMEDVDNRVFKSHKEESDWPATLIKQLLVTQRRCVVRDSFKGDKAKL